MPQSTPDTFNAFGLPLVLQADIENSTAGQAGPRAGIPTPATNALGQKPRLILGAQGEQVQDTVVTVETIRGGNLGVAAGIWTQAVDGAAAEDYRGGDLPVSMQGFDAINWGAAGQSRYSNVINLASGKQLLAYTQRSGAGVAWIVVVRLYDPDTDTYGSAVNVRTGLDSDHAPWPCLLQLDTGAILIAYWVADDGEGLANIDIDMSLDDGATWTTYAQSVLQQELVGLTNVTLNRLWFTIVQQQMILVFHLTDTTDGEQIWQWFSPDVGATFEFLGIRTDYAYPVLNVVANTAYMHYLSWTTTGPASVYVVAITPTTLFDPDIAVDLSQYGSLNVGNVADIGGGILILSRGDLAACVEGYWLWCWAISTNVTEQYGQAFRFDTRLGAALPQDVFAYWWYDGQATTTEYPKEFCATFYRNQVRINGGIESTSSTYEFKLSRWDLGGYTTVTMPLAATVIQANNYLTWNTHYIPSVVPASYGWTHTGAGTQDVTTTPGWLYNSTSANTSYDTLTRSVASDEGMFWFFRVRQVSGGSITSTAIGATLEVATALTRYKAALHVTATQVRIQDVHGAAARGTVAISTTSGVDVRIAINFGKVSAWVRLTSDAWDRNWTEIVNGGTLTDGGAGGADEVIFGNITSATAISEWQIADGADGTWLDVASTIADGFDNPADLHAFTYEFGPWWLAAGIYYTARLGPAFPGDEYTIYPFAQYPICYALPRGSPDSRAEIQGGQQPSPQVETRSLDLDDLFPGGIGTALWRWQYPEALNRYIPPILIVQVEGLNVPSATVRSHAAGGISTSRGTLNMMEGAEGLAFTRVGNLLFCDTATASTDTPWLTPDILAGGYAVFADDSVRPIVTNSAGNWGNSGTGQPPYVEIDGDNTEPASGFVSFIWPRATFVLYSDGTLSAESFELYWGSRPLAYEDYIKVGSVSFCEGIALYDMPSWTDVRDGEPMAEVFSSQFGVDRPRQTGTARDIRELPIVSTYWDGRLRGTPASTVGERVYFKATSSSYPIIAASSDTAHKLFGLWYQAKGGAVPVVHVGRMTRGTPNDYTLTGLDAGFLGTLASITPRFTATVGRDTGGVYAVGETGGQWILRRLR